MERSHIKVIGQDPVACCLVAQVTGGELAVYKNRRCTMAAGSTLFDPGRRHGCGRLGRASCHALGFLCLPRRGQSAPPGAWSAGHAPPWHLDPHLFGGPRIPHGLFAGRSQIGPSGWVLCPSVANFYRRGRRPPSRSSISQVHHSFSWARSPTVWRASARSAASDAVACASPAVRPTFRRSTTEYRPNIPAVS